MIFHGRNLTAYLDAVGTLRIQAGNRIHVSSSVTVMLDLAPGAKSLCSSLQIPGTASNVTAIDALLTLAKYCAEVE